MLLMSLTLYACFYNKKREKQITRLHILKRLPGNEGELNWEKLHLIDRECFQEADTIRDLQDNEMPTACVCLGRPVYFLDYEVYVLGRNYIFSWNEMLKDHRRLFSENMEVLIRQYKHDMLLCDDITVKQMKNNIIFLEWCIKKNLVLFAR